LALGLINLVAFARHATGHEHYVLLLLPFVAVSTAMTLVALSRVASAGRGTGMAVMLALGLAADSGRRFANQRPDREQSTQWWQAARVRPGLKVDTVYVRPDGVSFVFLYAVNRQVVPFSASSAEAAVRMAATHRQRFGLPPGDVMLMLFPDDPLPEWFPDRAPDVGTDDGFRFWSLPL
jgi:hypothetical protein